MRSDTGFGVNLSMQPRNHLMNPQYQYNTQELNNTIGLANSGFIYGSQPQKAMPMYVQGNYGLPQISQSTNVTMSTAYDDRSANMMLSQGPTVSESSMTYGPILTGMNCLPNYASDYLMQQNNSPLYAQQMLQAPMRQIVRTNSMPQPRSTKHSNNLHNAEAVLDSLNPTTQLFDSKTGLSKMPLTAADLFVNSQMCDNQLEEPSESPSPQANHHMPSPEFVMQNLALQCQGNMMPIPLRGSPSSSIAPSHQPGLMFYGSNRGPNYQKNYQVPLHQSPKGVESRMPNMRSASPNAGHSDLDFYDLRNFEQLNLMPCYGQSQNSPQQKENTATTMYSASEAEIAPQSYDTELDEVKARKIQQIMHRRNFLKRKFRSCNC